jgi:hypothetical protein
MIGGLRASRATTLPAPNAESETLNTYLGVQKPPSHTLSKLQLRHSWTPYLGCHFSDCAHKGLTTPASSVEDGSTISRSGARMESASSFPHRMATMCRDNLTRRTTSSQSKKLILRKERLSTTSKKPNPSASATDFCSTSQ